MADNSRMAIFCYHEKYWSIAVQRFDELCQVVSRRDALVGAGVREFDEINTLLLYNKEIESLSFEVIVFSALAAEACINDYAIRRTSKSFFQNYLDRLDPVAKWIVVPRLVTGKEMATSCRGVELYRQLIALRNRLVHWKTRMKPMSEVSKEDWIGEDQAEMAISAVRELIPELRTVDPQMDTQWLKEPLQRPEHD